MQLGAAFGRHQNLLAQRRGDAEKSKIGPVSCPASLRLRAKHHSSCCEDLYDPQSKCLPKRQDVAPLQCSGVPLTSLRSAFIGVHRRLPFSVVSVPLWWRFSRGVSLVPAGHGVIPVRRNMRGSASIILSDSEEPVPSVAEGMTSTARGFFLIRIRRRKISAYLLYCY